MILKNYLNNPRLKRAGQVVSLTQDQVDEYKKCALSPQYFIENYVKVVTIDHGLVPLKLYDCQKEIIDAFNSERRVLLKAGRQIGKTTTTMGYLLWFILFNEQKQVAILANKEATSKEILGRIKLAYENLPLWLQQGVVEWNKISIDLENGCKIIASSTSSSAIRGFTFALIYLDEFAFVPHNIADEFFTSVYPTISSGKTSKIIISSTPNGMNHFYKLCIESGTGYMQNGTKRNGFKLIEINWRQVPGRDQKWADEQRAILGENKFLQEMECEFLGSAGTLISNAALKSLAFVDSMKKMLDGLEIYEEVDPTHSYVLSADTARGTGKDYSAFTVIDVTQKPYKVVAKYRNNVISPMLFPNVIQQVGKHYNEAYLLIENNDLGAQVADILMHDLEYDNMFTSEEDKKGMTRVGQKLSKKLGIKTTKTTKRIGCNALKSLIENQQLVVTDFNVIEELSTFVLKKNGSYEADDGANDDLVMCLVLFAWLTTQPFFRDLTDVDIRQRLFQEKIKQIEEMFIMPASSNDLDEQEMTYGIQDQEMTGLSKNDDLWFEVR